MAEVIQLRKSTEDQLLDTIKDYEFDRFAVVGTKKVFKDEKHVGDDVYTLIPHGFSKLEIVGLFSIAKRKAEELSW